MSHIEIEKAAYYLHLKYPSNSSETNWYLAKRELELNLDRKASGRAWGSWVRVPFAAQGNNPAIYGGV